VIGVTAGNKAAWDLVGREPGVKSDLAGVDTERELSSAVRRRLG
jgi:hypothetical protein